jgi:hypothetical protein
VIELRLKWIERISEEMGISESIERLMLIMSRFSKKRYPLATDDSPLTIDELQLLGT